MSDNFKLEKWYYGVAISNGDSSIGIGQLSDEDVIFSSKNDCEICIDFHSRNAQEWNCF